jgi:hypothetical protein
MMPCHRIKYPNFKEYCITCEWGSRFGCTFESPPYRNLVTTKTKMNRYGLRENPP